MSRPPPREANVEEEFYRLLRNVLEKKHNEIEKFRFGGVEPQYPVDGKKADLMVLESPSKPLLVIECKKKVDTERGVSVFRQFDPMSSKVIDQALSYASHTGASLFATTNGKMFALFLVPERGEAFRIDRHRLFIKEIQLNEQIAEEILTLTARWRAGLAVTRIAVDWVFIMKLRSFVNYLASQILPSVEAKLETAAFREKFERFTREVGGGTAESYARESAYILMNKIVFHKILERYYKLTKLRPIGRVTGSAFAGKLRERFNEAMRITDDFEPVFNTGIYDEAPLPDEEVVLEEIDSFINDMEAYKLEEVGSDVVGFIYESLIPKEERHRLGQFYTPPQIAELITKWAIRDGSDKILDPASGSGTFLVKAYGMLKKMKAFDTPDIHKEILSQIYAVDINPFPAQLTAVNLAIRDVRHPTSEMNIVVGDFFHLQQGGKAFAPFTVKGVHREERREIDIPKLQAVVANPPYTRWTELSNNARVAVTSTIGATLSKYKMTAGTLRSEPMIYVHFFMHAADFLEQGGRIGMIVSNNWLQTSYGIKFGRYLLDHFRINAVIDYAARLFPIPLIATCVILAEREADDTARKNNQTVLMYVDKKSKVEDLLSEISKPKKKSRKHVKNSMLQSEIDPNGKWLSNLFGGTHLEALLKASKFITTVEQLFSPLRGNTKWAQWASKHGSRVDLGATEFFCLDENAVKHWGIQDYVEPALISSRNFKTFILKEPDWRAFKDKGSKAFLFVAHKPRKELPQSVRNYVEWGETQCRTKTGALAPESDSCQRREHERAVFNGWYDIGGTIRTAIFGTYRVQYRHRFGLASFPTVIDTDLLSFIPKTGMTEDELKATLAYMNSTYFQLLIEIGGISTGGGMTELEMSAAEKLPILNAGRVPRVVVKELASLFDELDEVCRKVGGADTVEKLTRLEPTFQKIDKTIARLLRIDQEEVVAVYKTMELLKQRRVARAAEARPEVVTGEEAPRIRPPRRGARDEKLQATVPLDKWT